MTRLRHCATGVLVTVMVGLWAGSAHAGGPNASITPDSGLTDQQLISVSGSGFPATDPIMIVECSGTVASPPADDGACDASTSDTTASADRQGNFVDSGSAGNGTDGFTVRAVKQTGVIGITCDATHPCVLYVGVQLDDFTQPHTWVALPFAASVVGTGSSAPGAAPNVGTLPANQPSSGATSSGSTPSGSAPSGSTPGSAPSVASSTGSTSAPASSPAASSTSSGAAVTPSALLPDGSLPRTGPPLGTVGIAVLAALLITVAAAVRRAALRSHDAVR